MSASGTDWTVVPPDLAPLDPVDDQDGDITGMAAAGPAADEGLSFTPGPGTYNASAASSSAAAPQQAAATPASESAARVVVRVPDDARLLLDGAPVEGTGRVRKFYTPELERGRVYTFDVRAIWNEGDRVVDIQRQIRVAAGEKADIDFLAR
jgi:uncharacterized protein (TIGR03000 family)